MAESLTSRPSRGTGFVLVAMIAAVAASRFFVYLVPAESPIRMYLWNFTPLTAIALFGGAHFHRRWAAYVVPLAAMVLSDMVLHVMGLARVDAWPRLVQQGVVYATFMAVVTIGIWLRRHRGVGNLVAATLVSSSFFWIVTNFAYWLMVTDAVPPEFRYPKTLAGLVQCYTLALPFLRNMLLGDAFYVTTLFGGYALVERFLLHPSPSPAVSPR